MRIKFVADSPVSFIGDPRPKVDPADLYPVPVDVDRSNTSCIAIDPERDTNRRFTKASIPDRQAHLLRRHRQDSDVFQTDRPMARNRAS